VRKLIAGIAVIALISVSGFFVALGVMGGTFAGVCSASDAATLNGNDNRSKIYNFWVENGFSPEVAVGITASIKHESGYSPFRQEESQSWPRGGYGIAQFTFGQRDMATAYMRERLGGDFATYYHPRYGGAVSEKSGFVPEGIPPEINDKFLSAQLGYLMEYISSFKPSSISVRVRGFESLTGISVPRESTLKDFLLSLSSPSDAARAWTFLYEYPANTRQAAVDRGESANEMFTQLVSTAGAGKVTGVNNVMEDPGVLKGGCGVGNLVSPTDGEGPLTVTSGFYIRTLGGITRPHTGIDITTGSKIHAVMNGTVVKAGPSGGLGNAVRIDHGNGLQTEYGHMVTGSLTVTEGQTVTAGQELGTMGNTGRSFGVHLHFNVIEDGEYINPFPFLQNQGIALQWAPGASVRNEKPGPL